MCVYVSEGDIAFTSLGVYGNVNRSDDTIISVTLTETVVKIKMKVDERCMDGL